MLGFKKNDKLLCLKKSYIPFEFLYEPYGYSEGQEDDIILEEIIKEVENFENKPKSNLEETEAVNLGDSETVKETRIRIHLSPSEKEEYIRFLKEYGDIFAWSYNYMTSLSTSIVTHKLPINPICPRVKKKLRKFKPDMSLKIKEEITKKIKANVLRVVEYMTWLANIVPVPKKDGKVRKVVKGQALADHLAENPVDREYEPLKMYFPDKEVSFIGEDITEAYDGWRMFFDGATNFKGVDIRAVLVSKTGQHYPISAKLRFSCTNNMAEYEAYILGLRLAIDMNVQELLRFTKIDFKHIPRIQTAFLDALATLSSMIQYPNKNFIDPIPIGFHKQPTYCAHVEEDIDGNSWFHDIKEYLEKGEYPEHAAHT
ncbi:uncharacterized protein [Nicotiana tomentosiformis]|uniref:uncharacterized protein n=1 Tax=Nicotiana tomentosiformis TaxID=4098 RepID=UPI00388C3DA4